MVLTLLFLVQSSGLMVGGQFGLGNNQTVLASNGEGQLGEEDVYIAITEDGFQPDKVTIFPGQRVHWTNQTGEPHTITAIDALFDSETLLPGSGFSISLAVPGAHSYISLYDEEFLGLIQVVLAEIRGPPDGLVNEYIPDIAFPPVDEADISDHPLLTIYASRTRIIVAFKDDTTIAEANQALADAGVLILGALPSLNIFLGQVPDTADFSAMDASLDTLRNHAAVEFVSLSPAISSRVLPARAESDLEEQMLWRWSGTPDGRNWGLEAARFPQAWNLLETIERNSYAVGTAIVDEGFDTNHLDLVDTLTVITQYTQPVSPFSTVTIPNIVNCHGTHVAGTIGASFNNPSLEQGRSLGVSGANSAAEMYGFSLSNYGRRSPEGAVQNIVSLWDRGLEVFNHVLLYAINEPHIRAINYSAGSITFARNAQNEARWLLTFSDPDDDGVYFTPNNQPDYLQVVAEVGAAAGRIAIAAARQGIMIIQAASNDSARFCPYAVNTCDDEYVLHARNTSEFAWASHHWGTERVPGSSQLPNPIIVVTSIGPDGNRATTSDFGGDISAPGVGILSTVTHLIEDRPEWQHPDNLAIRTDSGYYGVFSGNSMAAPHVTGAIGYLLAYDSSLSIDDIRSALLTWTSPAAPGQHADVAPNLNIYASLLSLPGAARHLVDINDLSRDGNRRVQRTLDDQGRLVEVEDVRFSPRGDYFTDPDGYVDIRDLRRFRDAWLLTSLLSQARPESPPESHIYLDGYPDHPKKDLNFDGCVSLAGLPEDCANETIGSRFDFNGSGLVTVLQARPVPLKDDGSPAASWHEAASMTDLEILWSQWSLDVNNPDNMGLVGRNGEQGNLTFEDIEDLLYSADVEIHAERLFGDGVDRVQLSISNIAEGRELFAANLTAPDDYRIATVPLSRTDPTTTELTVTAQAMEGDTILEEVSHTIGGLRYGEDQRVDLFNTYLHVNSDPGVLPPDGTSTSIITARLILGSDDDGDELQGLPITFAITPGGDDHAYLEQLHSTTDAQGVATTTFRAGTKPETYTVTATLQRGADEFTAQVKVNLQMRIYYIWQQTNQEFWREGTTFWPDLVTPETPDASSPEVGDQIIWGVDHSRLELDPDHPESRLLRRGVLYGWGDNFSLDEEVAADPVHFKNTWQVSRPDGSESESGVWYNTFQPHDPMQYQEFALPSEVRAEYLPDSIVVHGLHNLALLDYLQQMTSSGQAPPTLSTLSAANLSAGSTWGVYAQRFTDTFEEGAGTFFQHGSGFSQPITFRAREDGTFEPYHLCITVEQDITRPAPLYTGTQIIGYTDLHGVRTPVVAPTPIYQPGQAPIPSGPGRVQMDIALTMVLTFGDEEVVVELPDCTEHVPPVANYGYLPVAPAEGQVIQFLDRSEHALHALVAWDWNFGDGTGSAQRSPIHRYDQSGSYSVTLTVTDSLGSTDSVTREVIVANLPPTAEIQDVTALEGEEIPIQFHVSDPGPGDRESLDVHLDIDTPDLAPYQGTVEAGTITLLYEGTAAPGRYEMTLTVTDGAGATATDTAFLSVLSLDNAELTASFRFRPSEPEVGHLVFFRNHSFSPDGDIVAWHWDFADGQTSSEREPAHRFLAVANYPVTLTVTDSGGRMHSITHNVPVGDPPEPPPSTYYCGSLSAAECHFLHLLNAYRIENNLPLVEYSPTLSEAARRHSQDMADNAFLDHHGTDGSNPWDRATDAGYPSDTIVGENVAASTTRDAEETFYQWKTSPGHHENMLRPLWRAVGLAQIQGADGLWYWTNKFGDLVDVPFQQQGNEDILSADGNHSTTLSLQDSDQEDVMVLSGQDQPLLPLSQIDEYPPVPALVILSASPGAGSWTTFTNRSRDAAGNPIAAILDPGDGSASIALAADQSHQHIYAEAGEAVVTLTATDSGGESLAVSRTLTIVDLIPTYLTYDGPESHRAGETVSLYAYLTEVGYESWEWGGGVPDAPVTFTLEHLTVTRNTTSSEESAGYVSVQLLLDLNPGEYTLFLSYPGDDTYQAAQLAVPFTVLEFWPPRVDAGGPYKQYLGRPITFSCRAWTREPGAEIVRYDWDLTGDGLFDATSESSELVHTYFTPFDGEVRVRVTDSVGGTAEDTTQVWVTETAPPPGLTTRVNLSSAGAEPDRNSYNPALSDDGRYVAFVSTASNLAEAVTTTNREHVYLRDRETGMTLHISRALDGTVANGNSRHPSMSADGRFIVFQSHASNLIEGLSITERQIYLYDRDANGTGIFDEAGGVALTLVTINEDSEWADDWSEHPAISRDGNYIVFASYATNLVPGVSDGYFNHIYVYERATGTISMVSRSSDGEPGDGESVLPSLSDDGRFIAFESNATNLVPNDDNSYRDIFVHDRILGTTARVSISSTGAEADWNNYFATISGDGRHVIFTSYAGNLVEGPIFYPMLYAHDRDTGKTTVVSVDSQGQRYGEVYWSGAISADGRFVAFLSYYPITPDDDDWYTEVLVLDRDANETGTFDEAGGIRTTRVSLSSTDQASNSDNYPYFGWADHLTPALSADGRFVAFTSWASNLTPGVTNGRTNIFLRDRAPEADVITLLNYTGPTTWVENSEVTLQARLTDVGTGLGVEGLSVSFALGHLGAAGLTDDDGVASVTLDLTPLGPGAHPLMVSYAGDLTHSPSQDVLSFMVVENTPPIAHHGGPYRVLKGEELFLDGSKSYDGDPGDEIVSWEWDLTTDGIFDNATGDTALLTWDQMETMLCGGTCSETGEFPIALKVTDSLGESTTTTTSVQLVLDYVLDVAPDVQAIAPGGSNAFAVSLSATDEFTGAVSLSVPELPEGLAAQFSPESIMAGDVSVLTLSAAPDAPTTIFDLIVVGTSGDMMRTGSATVRVAFGLVPVAYGTITGQITDADTGAPIEGARVFISTETFITDEDGYYYWDQVPLGPDNAPASYWVRAEHDGYWPAQTTVTAISGVVMRADLALAEVQTGSVGGHVMVGVMDGDDVVPTVTPLPGATIRVVWPNLGPPVSADDAGEYLLENLALNPDNASRTYRIRASAEGFWSEEKTLSVGPGMLEPVDFALVEMCFAHLVAGSIFMEIKEDDDTISVVPADGSLLAVGTPANQHSQPGWYFGTSTPTTISNPGSFFPGSVTGVAGDQGEFLMDFPVSLTLGHNNIPPGRFAIYVAFPTAWGESGPTQWVSRNDHQVFFTNECGEDVEVHILVPYVEPTEPVPETAGHLHGWVFDEESGEPIQNASVVASHHTLLNRSASTDQNGYFEISDINLGGEASRSFTVTANASGYWSRSAQVSINNGETARQDFTLMERRFAHVEGTVTHAVTGLPLEGAQIREGQQLRATTNEDGYYHIANLPLNAQNQPRGLNLHATKDDYWYQSQYITLHADETSLVDFQLLPKCTSATISGLVVNALTLEPIEGASVTAAGQAASTNAEGYFQLLNIETGYNNAPLDVWVTASASGFHPQSKLVTVYCGAQIIVDFGRVETDVGTIIGTVTSSMNGRPLPDVFIGSAFGGSATTDAAGNYRLSNVPLGEGGEDRQWDVTAFPPLLGIPGITESVTARAGVEVRLDFQFDLAIWELTLSKQGEGTVTPELGTHVHYHDTTIAVEADPASGWIFSHWQGDVDADLAQNPSITLSMDQDRTLLAVFVSSTNTLTLDSTVGGSVTVPGEGTFTYNLADVTDLVAHPDAGYRFVAWIGDIVTIADATQASTTITMDGDYVITAEFEEIPLVEYDLTVSSTAGGTVTQPGEGTFTYAEGELVDLVAQPDAGYHFVAWTGDIVTIADATQASTAITMDGDYVITAEFERKTEVAPPPPPPLTPEDPPMPVVPDGDLVARMPGFVGLSNAVKVDEVETEIIIPFDGDGITEGHSPRVYYWHNKAEKWIALASYTDADGRVRAINDGGYQGWFRVFGVLQPHFHDVHGHWAEDIINRMNGLGMIEGYPIEGSTTRTAGLDRYVTRAEFTVFLNRLLRIDPNQPILLDLSAAEIEDILTSHYADAQDVAGWAQQEIASATKAGLVLGRNGGFEPGAVITRIEAALMVTRALRAIPGYNYEKADFTGHVDYDEIPEWVGTDIAAGILNGYPNGELRPNENLTRSEALTILYRLFVHGMGW